ncbi:hypothetical protein L6164_018787 [Bauhinia variegata]|uniref:Uncharacterized protein n=1 Tax=Bauhinia variegata TaxID=167791 RepID=A0ACB9ND63_BAUVA|nr:hypothetical protein L6164_018787 [Bauhinia variegata]
MINRHQPEVGLRGPEHGSGGRNQTRRGNAVSRGRGEGKLEAPQTGSNSRLISAMTSRLLFPRRLSRLLKPSSAFPSLQSSNYLIRRARLLPLKAPEILGLLRNAYLRPHLDSSRSFCSRSLNLKGEAEGPTAIDYRSVLQEDEFQRLADSTIHDLQEKFEDYGEFVDVDGFDIDYGNDVLTLQLGNLGTYVLNKQTPNRQIWLSSPVSGPSRFDWDQDAKAWIYRRNKSNLYKVLESELEQLCGKPLLLS